MKLAAVLGASLFPISAWGGAISIQHPGVGCVEAGKFVRLEARVDPEASVARAQVYFKASDSAQWYSVPMQQEGMSLSGLLPKPSRKLAKFDYYISVLDASFGESRTAEFSPSVVSGRGGCGGKVVALGLATAQVVVAAPAGAAAGAALVPAGFAADGVIAGAAAAGSSGAAAGGATAGASSGGISGTTLGIAGGVVAAGAVVAAKVIGGGPDEVPYSGPYSGTLLDVVIVPNQNNNGCSRNELHSGTLNLDVATSSDGTVTGNGKMFGTGRVLEVFGACAPGQVGESQSYGCDLAVSGKTTSVQGHGGMTYPNNVSFACAFSGSLTGSTVAGTLTLNITAPFPSQGGSTVFQVTLSKQ